jgi:hypothetical protein
METTTTQRKNKLHTTLNKELNTLIIVPGFENRVSVKFLFDNIKLSKIRVGRKKIKTIDNKIRIVKGKFIAVFENGFELIIDKAIYDHYRFEVEEELFWYYQ